MMTLPVHYSGSRTPAHLTREHHQAKLAPRSVRARFDAEFTTPENRRHWALADSMSIDAAANPGTRHILRMRHRYEYHNNAYYQSLSGIVTDYTIGVGPQVRFHTKDRVWRKLARRSWKRWAQEVDVAGKLAISREARFYNGESFMLLRTNPGLQHEVKLDLVDVEADRFTSPVLGIYPSQFPDQYFDGLILDRYGNPVEWQVLRQHPGAYGAWLAMGTQFDNVPARYVLHNFKPLRPEQRRGVPEANPVLGNFARLRRYCIAVLGAAETAADYAVVAESDAPAGVDDEDGGDEGVGEFDTFELKPRMGTILPKGYKLGQIDAKQPTTTYEMFVNMELREISVVGRLPLMFISLDARQANMSSAYVVTQPFAKAVIKERKRIERRELFPMVNEFIAEAALCGCLPPPPDDLSLDCFWPSLNDHADPSKVVNAQSTALASGLTNLPREYAKQGLSCMKEMRAAARSLGLSLPKYQAMLCNKIFGTPAQQQKPTDDESDDADVDPESDKSQDD